MNRLRRALPPLASLLPFEAAARHESVSSAAAELHLSAAAISRQVRALEANLGVALFERRHRAVVLTEAGRELAQAVANGLESIAGTARQLRARSADDEVVLLTEMSLAMYWLIPRLPDFNACHADVRIRVNASNRPLTFAKEAFDLAIQCSTRPHGALEPRLSFPDEVFPVCSPTVAEAETLDIDALTDYPLLHCYDDPANGWMSWTDWLIAAGASGPAPAGPTYDTYTVALQAAVTGQGIALGWGRGLEHLLATGALVRPTRARLRLEHGLSVYAPTTGSLDSSCAQVLEWLGQALASAPD